MNLNKVRGYRTMLGLTQEEMAKRLGVSTPTYRAYEEDPNKMSVETANKFLEVINEVDSHIKLDDVFSN